MARHERHIVKNLDGGWEVKKPHADTKAEAIDRARDICINEKKECVIQDKDGKIQNFNSYGNDQSKKLQNSDDSQKFDYDIAFSYATEQKGYVDALAIKLKNMGIKVFYDEFEEHNLWGKDLYEYLDEIYGKKSKYCVIFISDEYGKKVWTTHERKSAQARAFKERAEYILPVRFDDTEIPGIRQTICYIDARKTTTEKLAKSIKLKLSREEDHVAKISESDRIDVEVNDQRSHSAKGFFDSTLSMPTEISVHTEQFSVPSSSAFNQKEAKAKMSQATRVFRSIVSKSVGSTEMELDTEAAEGTVKIESATLTNFGSQSGKITVGILIPNNGNPEWHPIGEPWVDVGINSPCFSDKIFYLKKGDMVFAKFELINLSRNANGNPMYSKLELNVHGIYVDT